MQKGRILRVRFGLNPNSSSLATDLTALVWGTAAFLVLVNLVDVSLRAWRSGKRGDDDRK